MQAFDVIAVGLGTVDFLVRVPPGASQGGKTAVREIAIEGGGPAATAAAVTGMLGYSTAWVGRVGRDDLAELMRLQLRRHGISDAHLVEDPKSRTPSAVIEVEAATAERTVFYSVEGYRPPMAADLPVEALRRARVVVVDAYAPELAEPALEIAKSSGVPTVFDYEGTDTTIARRLIRLASHTILPCESARALTGRPTEVEMLAELARWTDGQVVITDGARGCWAWTGGERIHAQPAFPVASIDTTGCGDAFHGAYAVGLLEEWPLAQRLEFAAWVAARVACRLGGRAGIPDRHGLAAADLSLLSPALRANLEAL
ncbi:MAG TPA: PfkB family carbohydrate kinase, partial [Opitutaceae bacterium]|nr:PfkB family carbohydrate kinase [Opitutaceae bacterium]